MRINSFIQSIHRVYHWFFSHSRCNLEIIFCFCFSNLTYCFKTMLIQEEWFGKYFFWNEMKWIFFAVVQKKTMDRGKKFPWKKNLKKMKIFILIKKTLWVLLNHKCFSLTGWIILIRECFFQFEQMCVFSCSQSKFIKSWYNIFLITDQGQLHSLPEIKLWFNFHLLHH